MKKLILLGLVLVISPAVFATEYRCSTEVGETVVVRKTVLKPGVSCEPCNDVNYSIPSDMVDANLSQNFPANEYVKDIPNLTTRYKRRRFVSHDNRVIYLETRYVREPGQPFDFEMTCAAGNDPEWPGVPHCQGKLNSPNPKFLTAQLPSFDREADHRAWFELTLGDKPHLGFIVRLFKETQYPSQEKSRISSSGEMKFFSEDPLFIQDVSVGAPMKLAENVYFDRASLELKFVCRALKSGEGFAASGMVK